MCERNSDLDGLDTVVELYRVFRADGETPESSWRWACQIAKCLEELAFQESVEADLAALPVMQ